jgi:beta-glucanase (GH16 family)
MSNRLLLILSLLFLITGLSELSFGQTQTPQYIQSANQVPQTPQNTVTVPFMRAQGVGDLNVVIVGWNDTAAVVSSVTDTQQNKYTLAVGPTQLGGALSQSIYYSTNIAAGLNSVTVTFSQSANYPDIRVLEYSGIDPSKPVDVSKFDAGTGGQSSTGTVTTTSATDLLIAGNIVQQMTTGPGTNFNVRQLTFPDGDIAEDQVVTSAGSYNATASLSGAGGWVMQMVAFRAAATEPNPPPTQTANATPPSQAVAAGMTKLQFDEECKSALDIGYGTDGHKWNAGLWYEPVPPPSDFVLNNGVLSITATSTSGTNLCTQYHDVSGGTYFQGGYFEARMLCNDWSAFWLYCAAGPTHTTVASNPLTWNNEIDIIETDPGAIYVNIATTTIHKNTSSNGGVPDVINPNNNNAISNGPVCGQWHTYGLLWTQSAVTWYVDNIQVCTYPTFASTWQPAQLILGVGPGGVPGSPSNVLPPITQVQWVRVWQQ